MRSASGYVVDETTECWLWQRSVTSGGYGKCYDGRKQILGHKFGASTRARSVDNFMIDRPVPAPHSPRRAATTT